jgi:hypothetical protein
MPDNPRKTAADRKFVSGQDHEIDDLARELAREYPNRTREMIERAIRQAKTDAHTAERNQVIGRARAILRE